ncbi:uncharacterized protein P174DRAFT_509268 [Aspergillus novofumigatus IBT 16806]|uniref:Aminoglycoside phosphotransferase domain-containing protein n=1 Tax=Aspergillus novofumigatus (strain IBT 16806) TaxID=1392255 RepID=A0A2I1CNQ9_ASPN1|nr:uncharacterized protein P174DRAFT_509268 [Aspergillus novofumigatus IBT 16806]PKX99251.1 hypothetical protein P174DRAFT_509268 [Aspergillus novofumigatus IBT 16806]
MSETAHLSLINSKDELFKYTSGRWIHNEHLRLAECYLQFDIPALMNVIAAASGHMTSDIVSFFKLAEGGFNCLFQATFRDRKHVITRLPYPSTAPERYAVASKAATLDYLRLHGLSTPEVYAWCLTRANLVGAEYIIMEKLDSTPLGNMWYSMTLKEQHKTMKQIIEWETRLMLMEFPVFRSIYYQRDLLTERKVPLSGHHGGEFCIGLIAHYGWWHGERSMLNIDRGPFGEQEMTWVKAYAKPCLPYERLYRELNNILIPDVNKVVGLIIWQHSTILPLGLAAGIPKYFQNYEYYDVIFDEPAILHQHLFKSVGSPWEGDLITLKAEMIHAGTCSTPIIIYPDRVVHDILALDTRQREADIKAKMLEAAETDEDRIGIQNHFPFSDFDENS